MSGFDASPNDPAGYTPGTGSTAPTDAYTGSAASSASADAGGYAAPGYAAPPAAGYVAPPVPGLPNPGLATLLGFIPGVGAMYNGQFAKGIAHVVIFAILISLSDHVNGIFGLLVAGWIFYMVFDAYQTARARRDGLIAPDPFGLNNIGEKMGVGSGPNWSDFTARPAAGAPPAPTPGYTYIPDPQTPEYRDAATHFTTGTAGSAYPAGSAYQDAPSSYATGAGGATYTDATGTYAAGVPPMPPPFVPPMPQPVYAGSYAPPLPPLVPGSNVPTGAIVLIGFGLIALLGTLSHRFYWSGRYLDGIIVGIVGLVLLITRTLRARGVYPAGSAASAWYVVRSSRVGLILLAIGVALSLDHAGVLTWEYLWPYLLILVGVFLLVERAAHNRMLAAGPVVVEPATGSFVPTTPLDPEGR